MRRLEDTRTRLCQALSDLRQYQDAALMYPLYRESCVGKANALMEAHGFRLNRPSAAGFQFDRLVAAVKEIDHVLPEILGRIPTLQRKVSALQLEVKQLEDARPKPKPKPTKFKSDVEPTPKIEYASGHTKAVKRWKDWGSVVDPVESIIDVTEADEISDSDPLILSDELDRRARATMRWAPWSRRERTSRRYEGFSYSHR